MGGWGAGEGGGHDQSVGNAAAMRLFHVGQEGVAAQVCTKVVWVLLWGRRRGV
jgi:hypothetical protein